MTLALGTVKPGSTITIPFNTFDSNDPSDSVIVSAFVLADIGIYKGTSMTERGSTTGVVLLDTDGINIDEAVGLHGFTIDLSSNATDDFYTAGSRYYVTVGPITIDGATTVSFIAATFDIGYPGAILDGQIATLASQTSFTITNAPTDDSALLGCTVIIHDQASATQFALGYVSAYTTAANTITLKADPGIFTMAAGDNVSFFMPANVQAVAGTTQTALDINDILDDTAEIGTAGAGLTAIAEIIFDEAMSGHTTLGTFGQVVNALGARTGAVNDGSASTTAFIIDGLTEATDNHFNGSVMVFTSGALLGQSNSITNYTGSSQTCSFRSAWTEAPAEDDEFVIVPGFGMGEDRMDKFLLSINLLTSGGALQATGLASNLITSAKIASNAVGASQLASSAVDEIVDQNWNEARSDHTTAGSFGDSFQTVVNGAAEAGTLSTTEMTTDLTEATNEHYNGRVVIWTSGVLKNQASDITAYLGSTGKLTYTAVTEAPSAADTFIIY